MGVCGLNICQRLASAVFNTDRPAIAQVTFKYFSFWADLDYAEGTGVGTGSTAITHFGNNDHGVCFVIPYDSIGWTLVHAPWILTVVTDDWYKESLSLKRDDYQPG
jgi:hypothetical protein